tara:strand:- start:39547 stop:40083 length:537 start_codon:yes stop_codon:yes gene_type:complete
MVKIQNVVLNILKDYGINKAPVSIEEIIRSQGINLKKTDLGNEISGILLIEDGKVTIGVNKTESPYRQRFSMAHELGHFNLHCDQKDLENKMFVDKTNLKVMYRKANFSQRELRREREANSFAASILMPTHLIESALDNLLASNPFVADEEIIERLAEDFEVSEISMGYRLSNLGHIN